MAEEEKNVIVHIGCLKTGTTTIQKVIESDLRVSSYIHDRYFNTEKNLKENKEYHGKNLFISDENICLDFENFSGLIPSLRAIHKKFPKAKILLTVREQRDLLLSAFKHHVVTSHMPVTTFNDFLVSDRGKAYIRIINYDYLYKAINIFFPTEQIIILPYEKMKTNFNGFFYDIYQLLNLTQPEGLSNEVHRKSANESFVKICGRMNRVNRFRNNTVEYKVLKNILKKIQSIIKSFYKNNEKIFTWENNDLHESIISYIAETNSNFFTLIEKEEYYNNYLVKK